MQQFRKKAHNIAISIHYGSMSSTGSWSVRFQTERAIFHLSVIKPL